MKPGYAWKTIKFYERETIGERIAKARAFYKMTVGDLAELAHLSKSVIHHIEHGQDFRVSTLFVLCRALDIAPDQLMRGCFKE